MKRGQVFRLLIESKYIYFQHFEPYTVVFDFAVEQCPTSETIGTFPIIANLLITTKALRSKEFEKLFVAPVRENYEPKLYHYDMNKKVFSLYMPGIYPNRVCSRDEANGSYLACVWDFLNLKEYLTDLVQGNKSRLFYAYGQLLPIFDINAYMEDYRQGNPRKPIEEYFLKSD
jgi:hypothetical protein